MGQQHFIFIQKDKAISKYDYAQAFMGYHLHVFVRRLQLLLFQ